MVSNPPPPAPATVRPTALCPSCTTQVPVDETWRFQPHAPHHRTTAPDAAPCPGSGTRPIRASLRAVPGAALRSSPTSPPPSDWLN